MAFQIAILSSCKTGNLSDKYSHCS